MVDLRWMMSVLNREGPRADITVGVDHYSVQAGLGLAMVVLTLLCAVWPRGRRLLGCSAGVTAAHLGLCLWASRAHPAGSARFGPFWLLPWAPSLSSSRRPLGLQTLHR